MIRAALPLLLLAACGVTEKSYPKDYADAVCDLFFRCEDEFADYIAYAGADDKAECKTVLEGQLTSYSSYYEESCTFDAKKATECIKEIRKLGKDCSKAYNDGISDPACYQIWTCN